MRFDGNASLVARFTRWPLFSTLLLPVLILADSSAADAEFTFHGALACTSLEAFKQLEHGDMATVTNQPGQPNPPCTVLPENHVARVVGRDGNYVAFVMEGSGAVTLWGNKHAVRRRKQPHQGNVAISDGNDFRGICQMLSGRSRSHGPENWNLAMDVLAKQRISSTASARYQSAISARDHELVVSVSAGQCIAEVDVAQLPLLACVLDTQRFFACRQSARDNQRDPSSCFAALCTAAATVSRPDPQSALEAPRPHEDAKQGAHDSPRAGDGVGGAYAWDMCVNGAACAR